MTLMWWSCDQSPRLPQAKRQEYERQLALQRDQERQQLIAQEQQVLQRQLHGSSPVHMQIQVGILTVSWCPTNVFISMGQINFLCREVYFIYNVLLRGSLKVGGFKILTQALCALHLTRSWFRKNVCVCVSASLCSEEAES